MGKLVSAALVLCALGCGPAAPDPDQQLYRRAYELTVAGREAEARAIYLQLVRPDGGSRYASDAHVALAEQLFKSGDFDAALEHYRRVEDFPSAPTRPYALYKQGWCYLNKGEARQALQIFERVVALENDDSIPEERRKPLVAEARKDLVKAYAKAGAMEHAAEYFQKLGGGEAPALLERLAEAYGEQGQWGQAASTLRELIATHVDSPRICAWQGSIVRATLATGTSAEQVAEVQRLGATLARLEAGKDVPPATVEDCRKRLRDVNKEMALLWHKKAQKTKDPELYRLVDPLYRQYLARFQKEKDAYDMTFYHAEILWTLERWADACDEYRRVVEMNPAGKFTKEAAYGAVLAAKNALEAEEGRPVDPRPGARAPVQSPQALSAGDRRLLGAFELYLAHVPSSPELPAIKYRRARLLYDRDHLAEAAPLFWQLALQHPDSELAIYAGNLHLDSLNALKRRDEVCASARALVQGPLAARDAQAQREWRKIVGDCERLAGRGKAAAPGGR
jgi:TolA-binding protein